jgi:hypothetical protein
VEGLTWFHWLWLSMTAVGVVAKVCMSDVPREPITKYQAAAAVVIEALMLWGFFRYFV